MITLTSLNNFLSKLLIYDKKFNLSLVDPYMANGLVYHGEEKINKIALAVSASLTVFEMAKKADAQALIVHHAFNFPPNVRYDQLFQNRYSFLVKNNLSLFGYHFLLDSHPQIGHNVSIIKEIGGTIEKPFLHKGNPWGYFGRVNNLPLAKIINGLKNKLSPSMTLYDFGPKNINRVVAISGRGTPLPPDIQYLVDNKVDLFITGENSEWIREIFREVKINYLAGGHYHTERFGILALEKLIKEKLEVETEFIELVNNV
ncbi:hypothetical protein COY13_03820 [Candidatus Roizmanbacteria bacterium CG_4_10_14_0_2_um_filter_36_35]|uniref:Nif3-like dinuclear metal center hexameric protein n=2 Tax=Candidatus Roizmaniibacteriota TaxID=1752723 RepID=A0A2M7BVL8_9BACT|nr:MAG: hypothetical protein COS50_04495 [Candidatus Roizmanbacteria bacterium CG03_land_8_20_14_0_80_35_26]PIZ67170.1 MAG: hypothetical protein COY13_03820 [Candidatus Roizmanbacteria bacterium CG_4_10_14_0_2_um_filter_36_35]PJC79877.1 MAG: hypothetical protein CO008_03775 [Candidatus Roizmanbacteria bacterium CG_4_8_14_3_um_filter_36_12]